MHKIHRNSETCQKHSNEKCRLRYGRHFTNSTIIAEALVYNISKAEKSSLRKKKALYFIKGKKTILTWI